jgi:signal transduction protein with GAF and PtsI domain
MERRGTMYDPLVVDVFIAAKDELSSAVTASIEELNDVEDLLTQPISTPVAAGSIPTRVAATQVELQRAIHTILVAVQRELETSAVLFYLKHRTLDELAVINVCGDGADELIGSNTSLGTRVSGWVAANARPIINTDAKLEFPDWPGAMTQTCSALPVRSATDVIGVLVVCRAASRPLTFDEVRFLEQITTSFDDTNLRDLLSRASSVEYTQPRVH